MVQSKCSQASFHGERRCPEAAFSQQGACPPGEPLTWEGRCAGSCTRAPGRAGGEPGGQVVATGKWVCRAVPTRADEEGCRDQWVCAVTSRKA